MRALWLLLALGCVKPAPMGVARVSVCITGETARLDRPRPTQGASVCVDFEPFPPVSGDLE